MKRQNSSLSSWPSPVLSLVRNPISTGEKLTTPPEIAEKKHGQQTSRQNLPGESPTYLPVDFKWSYNLP